MEFVTSWDDGHQYDEHLARLLIVNKLPGTFYIPNGAKMTKAQIIRLRDLGFEIGGHTVTHPENMHYLDPDRQFDEISDNKLWLQGFLNQTIDKFCYPSGRFDNTTKAIVKRCSYREARTTLVGNTRLPEDLLAVKTTVHVHPDRKEYDGMPWFRYAKNKFLEADGSKHKGYKDGEGGYFHIWGHSWEIEKHGLWSELTDFFEWVSKKINK